MPPDASAYRSTLTVLSLAQLVGWAVLYYTFSFIVLPMQREFGWTLPQMMGAYTAGLATWGLASYGVGAAIDRGKARQMMSIGAVLAGLGLLLWSQAQALWMLYAAWVLIGAAMAGTLYDAAFSTVTRRFPSRYRSAVTTLTLVGGFASTLAYPALATMVPALGWRDCLLVLSGVMGVGVAGAHAWALRPVPMVTPNIPPTDGPSAAPARTRVLDEWTFAQASRHNTFWLLAACFTAYAFVVAAFWAHAIPAFTAKGISEAQTVAVLFWVGPAQVAGRALYVVFAKRLSARTLGLLVLSGVPLSMTLLAFASQSLALFSFAVIHGFSNGLVTIVRGTTVPEMYGHVEVARISGALAAIVLIGRAGAPLIAAWLLLAVGGYVGLLLCLAALGTASVLAFGLARQPRH